MNADSALDTLRSRLSPAKLALLEKQLRGNAAKRGAAPAIPRLALADAPLSYGQQRLWFLWSLEPEGARYNLAFRLRIRGELDVAALGRSLEEIVRRHEVLRSAFVAVDGEPRQVVCPAGPLELPRVELGALPEREREAALEAWARQAAGRPFDLAAGKPLRVQLAALGETDHALLLVLHHSVSDAWSLGILVREFAGLYPAFHSGQAPALPELPVQYADYAVWQRDRLQGAALETTLAYWRERLAGAPAVLALSTDAGPGLGEAAAESDEAGAVYTLELPAELGSALNRLSRSSDATLFMILAAAFNVLLFRHSGQTDLCIGYPAANRPLAELEGLIGFFLNTLVLRTDLSGDPSFTELLARVRQAALDAQAHQELPFEKLVEALQPERAAGRNPLFQVMLVLQNAFSGSLELPGLQVDAQELELPVAKFDLTLSVSERAGRLRAAFEYRTALFRASTIARMAQHWRNLLESIVAGPHARLSELALLTDAEQRQLAAWNANAVPLAADGCLHSRFEAQARQSPDSVAVVHGGQRLSYRELNEQANRLAHALRQRRIQPDERVGLCVAAGPAMAVGVLGILKAGGAYVPLDPSYPLQRSSEVLADCGAVLVVTEAEQRDALAACGVELLCLDRERPELEAQPSHNPPPVVHPGNAAYLIYTSGSTGRPKGVVVSHRNAVHSTAARESYYPEALQGFLLLSSYAFDSSVAGIFWTLGQGGKLCLPGEDWKQDPPALARLIAQEQLSHLLCLPALYGLLLEQAEAGQLATLRAVIVAGEACPPAVAARHRLTLPAARLYNEYGPTEGSVWCSVHAVQAEDGLATSVPIGRPIANAQIHLLDAQLNPVPIGVPGELHLGGVGLARGYHQRPDLTAERFIPNPYGEPGERLYKTGDLARYREDGVIDFLGRIDSQIKIRGYRVEPGEIEARLLEHPAIQSAAVLARQDGPGGARLVAYLVSRGNQAAPEAESLRIWLKAGLPDYMVPAAYVALERLPLTPNGKLDRNALPAPDGHSCPGRLYEAPRGEAEELLARLWGEVLGGKRVGRHDNFFALGGDSILAMQLVGRARQAGLAVSPRQLFQQQTVAELALVAGKEAAIQAEQGPVSGDVPLTPIQHWFFERQLANPHYWNQSVLLEASPQIDAAMVESAIEHLLVQHDALRMRFQQQNGAWLQTGVADEPHPLFHRVDLSRTPAGDLAAAIQTESARRQAGLHLGSGPLLRAVWFERGQGSPALLLLVIHHLVVDGVSWRILLEDLQTACGQLAQNQPVVLPAKTSSFRAWATRLQAYAQSPLPAQAIGYWLQSPYGQVKPLPVDLGDGCADEHTTASVAVSLDRSETSRLLHEIPATYRIAITDLLIASLAAALASWSHDDAVLINLEGHGREALFDDIDLSRTVGWFTSLYPQVFCLPKEASHLEKLLYVKQQLESIPGKGIGYGVARYLRTTDDWSCHLQSLPSAQVIFNYFCQFDGLKDAAGLFSLAQYPYAADFDPRGKRVAELGVDARVLDGCLRVEWNYSNARYTRATIERLAQAQIGHLHNFVAELSVRHEFPWQQLVAKSGENHYRELLADAVLDADIAPPAGMQNDGGECRAVLLTGVTGFVGAFLLDELLNQTPAVVYCLVRAGTEQEASHRLFQNLAKYGLSVDQDRVVALRGDLSQPNLGLAPADFMALSLKIDAIYHNGCLTNLVQPYFALRSANVLGTKEVIRLACLDRPKPIHYVSTLSVFGDAPSPGERGYDESSIPHMGPWLSMGYAQTKWVAERLIGAAGERGCPVAIYRLGTVTGHSGTAAWNRDDFQCRLLQASITLGKVPAIGPTVDMTPVDYVARSVVYLSLRRNAHGEVFHLLNPNPMPIDGFVALLNRIGYPVEKQDYGQWKSHVLATVGNSPEHVLYPFLANFDGDYPEADAHETPGLEQRFECAATLKALQGSNILCPPIDAALLQKYLSYVVAAEGAARVHAVSLGEVEIVA